VEVVPWRLALVVVMPSLDGLTDRHAADAIRRGRDGQPVGRRRRLSASGVSADRRHLARPQGAAYPGSPPAARAATR
jgi:hypothetical protein